MRSYGILTKELDGEYLLIHKEETPEKSILRQLKEPLALSFYIFSEDPFLLNYSDFLFEDLNIGFLLTNRNPGHSKGHFFLHKNEFISAEEKVIFINGYNALSNYCQSEEETLVLTKTNPVNGNKEEIFQGKFKDLKKNYSFLNLLETGSFDVLTELKSIRCYAVEQTSKKLFGVLELIVDPEYLNTGGISCQAVIGSKQVVWRYYIVNREQVRCKDFKIYSGKTLLSIKEESQKVLGNGENAYLLETSDPIAISERYENLYELEFVKEDLKTGQVLSKKRVGLPVPEISKIKISKMEKGYEAYSDMYIYL